MQHDLKTCDGGPREILVLTFSAQVNDNALTTRCASMPLISQDGRSVKWSISMAVTLVHGVRQPWRGIVV